LPRSTDDNPEEYKNLVFSIRVGEGNQSRKFFKALVDAQYKRNNLDLAPGSFRVRGDIIEIVPATTDEYCIKIDCFGDEIEKIRPLTLDRGSQTFHTLLSRFFRLTDTLRRTTVSLKRAKPFRSNYPNGSSTSWIYNKLLEAQRLEMRTRQDMESLQEFGMCPGIETILAISTKENRGTPLFVLWIISPRFFDGHR
jgi:excinuclease ABC subunit B